MSRQKSTQSPAADHGSWSKRSSPSKWARGQPQPAHVQIPRCVGPPADNAHPFAYHYKTGHRPQSFLRFWGAETHSPRQDFIFDGCRSSSRTSPFGEDSFSGRKALRAFAQFACQPICTT
ncbi:hypothetical protein K443DRAFT_504831 [Laccaria amethystina LaAM-08-1]|uniref:Uncharacterized protein n=1 Tax=Laccaria amethystina LaAM-08-1 TaxID=1095629 RepID=A0A0C9WHH0_9AGAR|nr:hypothetical protein K443DRAFT_504831 [Laccaria amethystina LaAM-08-1]